MPGPFRFGAERTAAEALDALDLEFLDAERALALRQHAGGLALELVRVDAPRSPTWKVGLPQLVTGSLDVDPSTSRWQVDGTGKDATSKILVFGRIGDGSIEELRWPLGESDFEAGYEYVAPSRAGALVIRVTLDLSTPAALLPFLGANAIHHRSELWLDGKAERRFLAASSFEVACHSLSLENGPFLCLAFDGNETHLSEVLPAIGERRPLGWLPGRHYAFAGPRAGTLATWDDAHRLTLIDVTRRRVETFRFTLPDRPLGVAFGGDRIGVVHRGESGSTLAIYERNGPSDSR